MPLVSPLDSFWTASDRARLTRDFVGKGYSDVEVKIIHLADNAAVVADSGGMHRVVLWRDMSFASEYIARSSQGAIVVLKVKAWS